MGRTPSIEAGEPGSRGTAPHVSSTCIDFVFSISKRGIEETSCRHVVGAMDDKVWVSALHGMTPGALLTPTGENFMFP